ncbi:TPR-like protein [Auriculariales sp. MPI-PUGE-AT-0066]|nr:TPR-like protein [Auriculariales sp. MPI-PUGE-AT-0066]
MSDTLKRLAQLRQQGVRASEEIVQLGRPLVTTKSARGKLGDAQWSVLEQVALAALDVGQIKLAMQCITILEERFPDSPRTNALQGVALEAQGRHAYALEWYDAMLKVDESNASAWKRKAACYRSLGQLDKAVEELSAFLDTVYGDAEAWLELADIYMSVNQYANALQSISHALLLAPHNPYYVLQAAETAYTAGDIPLAARYYLRAVEMLDGDASARRAWFGVKLTARRLHNDHSASHSASDTEPPQHLQELELLATERLSAAYVAAPSKATWSVVERWLKA